MSPGQRQPAHRRGAAVHDAVLKATAELLLVDGRVDAQIPDIAAHAGVNKTSIYRRWGSRTKLIAEALSRHVDAELALPDTGSVRKDLVVFYTGLADFLSSPAGRSMTSLVFTPAAEGDDSLRQALAQFWELRLTRARSLVQRGIDRGELAPNIDPDIVVESATGALNLHILLRDQPADASYIGRLVDLAYGGVR
ncbi:hypothetical protein AWB85_03990 [Mycobacteroides immunogenum]|uniref:HTH tetR-type domain-containing protein n=1 Tax=Mycobacteroides immunogenum TaxID=83262 RepID=A0A179VFI0_9MYCO|nr:TetR/AcrR family transcriptional regulator [Mycobacteroides immunogenum]OAT70504.1 hypothetical protein AWB85_03990 [Mycobacteroides immunogenum]